MGSLQAANVVCLALSRDTVIRCPISTWGGFQPLLVVMPQLIQSRPPLGPLSGVTFSDNDGGQIYSRPKNTSRDVLVAPIGEHWPGPTLITPDAFLSGI